MNRDMVKGAAKDALGKIQRLAGKLIGSPKQRAKGGAKQVAGKAQKAAGRTRRAAKRANRATV